MVANPGTGPAAAPPKEDLARMSFGDHLDELRKRLLRSVFALLAAITVLLPFHDEVQEIVIGPYRILWKQNFREYAEDLLGRSARGELTEPTYQDYARFLSEANAAGATNLQRILDDTWPRDLARAIPEKSGFRIPYELVAVQGLEDFWTFMLASLIFALAMASPVVIWQGWAFIAAGLYARERTVFYKFFPFMMVLLCSGILFGYFAAVPYSLGFLIRLMNSGQVAPMLSVGQYFSLLFALTTALGIVFQLPLVMMALQRVGLVRHVTMRKHWRAMVLGIFVAAAVFTPPDPFSMFLMALPTLLLYVLGLVLTWTWRRNETDWDAAAAAAGS